MALVVISEDERSASKRLNNYIEAYCLLLNGAFEKCIEAAKRNPDDPTLLRWQQMKNHILIACAEEDWHASEVGMLCIVTDLVLIGLSTTDS